MNQGMRYLMSMFNDIFGKKSLSVEYSNLQFPNTVIICNTPCFCVVLVIVAALHFINA